MILITIPDAMHRLSVSRATIYKLLSEGELKSVKIGRSRRIPLESIESLVGGAK